MLQKIADQTNIIIETFIYDDPIVTISFNPRYDSYVIETFIYDDPIVTISFNPGYGSYVIDIKLTDGLLTGYKIEISEIQLESFYNPEVLIRKKVDSIIQAILRNQP